MSGVAPDSDAPTSTEALVEFTVNLTYETIPQEVVSAAKRSIADTVAATFAGARTETAALIRAVLGDYGLSAHHEDVQRAAGEPARVAPILGTTLGGSRTSAALLNGTHSHALDLDDDEPAQLIGHPSGPVVAALLSFAATSDVSGREFIAAYVAGVEAEIAIGAAINPGHWWNGWHPTATLGTVGAAVACGRILRLDRQQLSNAVAIAASMASGIRANFGTMTKPLHVGRASEGGALAAALAAVGFTGAADVLDGPLGLPAVFGMPDPVLVGARLRALGHSWGLLSPGVAIKRFPSCSNTHPAVDATLQLRSVGAFNAPPERLVCRVAPGTEKILLYDDPSTPLEAKFSLPYCVSVAAVHGCLWLQHFELEAMRDPAVRSMMDRVEVVLDPLLVRTADGVTTSASIEVHATDGSQFSLTKLVPRGSARDPLTEEELQQKFTLCLADTDVARAHMHFQRLMALEHEASMAALIASICSVDREQLSVSTPSKAGRHPR